MTHLLRHPVRSLLTAGALLLAGLPTAAVAEHAAAATDAAAYGATGSYSYVRSLDGDATLVQGDTGERDAAVVNQPVLAGDRLWVAHGSRAEVVLSDGSLVRLDADTEVAFEALAGAPDADVDETRLRLERGNLQLVVTGTGLATTARVDTPSATVYVDREGRYRITADGDDWTEVVVRDGAAELVTRRGAVPLATGERGVVDGYGEEVLRAGREDSLERWGRSLEDEVRRASLDHVDPDLRYQAAGLDRYGSWVRVEGRAAWRPRVASDWRPYYDGRWRHTPAGLTWVSYEPWGWVPYHYGTWDYMPGYGWVWFPGRTFAPAWVYWHWSDSYVGWIPTGYYARYYHPRYGGLGLRFGTYGWAGGGWGYYDYWNFCPIRYVGYGRQHHHVRSGRRFAVERGGSVPRGILTTDTRGLDRRAIRRDGEVVRTLAERRRGDLPDATAFVARRGDLPDDLRERVLVDRRAAVPRDDGRPPVVEDGTGTLAAITGGRDAVGRADAGRPGTAVTKPGVPTRDASGRAAASRPRVWDRGGEAAERGRGANALPDRPLRGTATAKPGTTPERPSAPRAAPTAGDDWRRSRDVRRRPPAETPRTPETTRSEPPARSERPTRARPRPPARSERPTATPSAPSVETRDWRSRRATPAPPPASAPSARAERPSARTPQAERPIPREVIERLRARSERPSARGRSESTRSRTESARPAPRRIESSRPPAAAPSRRPSASSRRATSPRPPAARSAPSGSSRPPASARSSDRPSRRSSASRSGSSRSSSSSRSARSSRKPPAMEG